MLKKILPLALWLTATVTTLGQNAVMVDRTNSVITYPLNFWTANALVGRSGLGFNTNLNTFWAATNAGTARTAIGALATNGNGSAVTNLTAANITGTVAISNGGTGSTNASDARTALGLGTAATNPATSFQPSSTVLSNLASSNGAGLTNLTAANITGTVGLASNVTGTVGLASNVTGTIAISNGGSGATTAGGAVTNFFTPNTPLVFATNGQVVANTGTNVLTFTSVHGVQVDTLRVGDSNLRAVFYKEDEGLSISIYRTNAETFIGNLGFLDNSVNLAVPVTFNNASNAATTRTNLGLGWSALTNSNAGTGLVSVNTNGEVVSPTNFWQVAPLTTTFIESQPTTNQTTNIAAGRNLHIHSIAPSTAGITNTIALPTTNSFNGDIALVVHQGPTSSVTAVRTAGASTNLITLNQFEEAVEFVYYNSVWQFNHNLSYIEPIFFSGTNAASNRAASRTNLGGTAVGNAIFTATNAAAAATAVGLGATNDVQFNTVNTRGIFDGTNEIIDIENNWLNYVGFGATFEWSATANTTLVPFAFGGTNSAAITRTNLGIPLAALTNTDVTNFRTAIGLGATNSVTFSNIVSSGTLTSTGVVTALSNAVVGGTLTSTGVVTVVTNLNVGGAIAVTNAAATRTNLGIPLAALTNTATAGFQRAILQTNSIPAASANLGDAKAWLEISVVTNNVTNSFRIPVFQ